MWDGSRGIGIKACFKGRGLPLDFKCPRENIKNKHYEVEIESVSLETVEEEKGTYKTSVILVFSLIWRSWV